jgi:protoporphyrinogen oxidase
MLPYNKKLWSYPLDDMGFGWVGERVALPPIESVKRSIKTGRDNTHWGGNATFRFPLHGGTGGLMDNLAKPFRKKIAFRHEAKRIDPARKLIEFKNGKRVSYRRLITSLPLDRLIKNVMTSPPPEVVRAAGELRYNSGWIVGIGINRKIKSRRCWVYFPDERFPFYRVTYFSNYSPHNVAKPGEQSSFLCETAFSPGLKTDGSSVVEATIDGLVRARLISDADRKRIATKWKIRIPRLYPIPAINRDASLKTIENYLEKHGIKSVGRFGGWRYEVGNMDHSFMAGYKATAPR